MPGFDYLTYTPGSSTPLNGQVIIQNDNDAILDYGGGWSVLVPRSVEFDDTLLYQGTAHWSRTVGDSVLFRFTGWHHNNGRSSHKLMHHFAGTSITVMGVSTPSEMNASLTFTLDGNKSLQTITQTNLTRTTIVRFFHARDLQPTQHALNINVTNIAAAGPIGIDFFAYSTSLSSLSEISTSATIHREKNLLVAMTGGIIGGLTFAVGLFFAWKRQRHRRFSHQFEMMAKDPS